MQNIKWQDKISNETLYRNTKQEPIVQISNDLDSSSIYSEEKKEFTFQNVLFTPQTIRGKPKQGRSKLLYPARLIKNEVQPTIDELRKIEKVRTE